MRKFYAAVLIILTTWLPLYGQSVGQSKAGLTALNFISEKAATLGMKQNISILAVVPVEFEGRIAYYAVDLAPEGFVLISASTNNHPVIAYSFEGTSDITGMGPAQQAWMEVASRNILLSETSAYNTEAQMLWNYYSSPQFTLPASGKGSKQVLPLNNLKWNQGDPYNYFCPPHPSGPGGRCYAGCVATAMGMIMKHWNYPTSGSGAKTYFWGSYYTVHFDSTQYNWSVMSNSINASNRDAIAELLFHCGVSVNMNYTPSGSGASTVTASNSLKQYFGYIPTLEIYNKIQFSDYDWKFLLKEEIDLGRPVLYSGYDGTGSGHAFVLDGYQDTMFWHFNWGWSGSGNGYFNLNYGDPKTLSFVNNQSAIMGIQPPLTPMCNSIEYTQQYWTVDDGSGISYYQNNRSCEYRIKPADGGPVSLSFLNFDTEAGQDILYIYDGEDATAPLIGAYSGNQLPPLITSSGQALFLKFETNSSVQRQGWKAAYSSLALGMASLSAMRSLTVFPNPAHGLASVSFFADENTPYTLGLLDVQGRELYRNAGFAWAGENRIALPLDGLTPGFYLVNLNLQGQAASRKLLVR